MVVVPDYRGYRLESVAQEVDRAWNAGWVTWSISAPLDASDVRERAPAPCAQEERRRMAGRDVEADDGSVTKPVGLNAPPRGVPQFTW